jgi:hypothetical protein
MSTCNFLAPNGEPSILYAALEQQFGSDKALQIWTASKAQKFTKEQFDVNGEPTIEAVTSENKIQQITTTQTSEEAKQQEQTPARQTVMLNPFYETMAEFTAALKTMYAEVAKSGKDFELTATLKSEVSIEGVKYKGLSLANVIDTVPRPANLYLTKSMNGAVNNLPKNFTKEVLIKEANPLQYDEKEMLKQMRDNFIELRDNDGNPLEKFFTAEAQEEAIDSMLYSVYMLYNELENKPELKAKLRAKRKSTVDFIKDYIKNQLKQQTTNPSKTEQQRADFQLLLNSFDTGGKNSVWAFTLSKLDAIGIKIVSNKIEAEDFDDDAGRGLKDWYDSSFELDVKDTASTRMKMFLLSIEDSQTNDEEDLRQVSISFSNNDLRANIKAGVIKYTFRSPKVITELGLSTEPLRELSNSARKQKKEVKFVVGTDIGANKMMRATVDKVVTQQFLDFWENRPSWNKNIIEETPKLGDVILLIEPYKRKQNILTTHTNYLGLPKLANYEELFQDLIGTLADAAPNFEAYLQKLEETNKPNLLRVVAKLKALSENSPVRQEFVSVMTNQYQRMLMVLFNKGKNGTLETRVFDSNRNSEEQTIIKFWQENQKESPILTKENDRTVVNKQLAKVLYDELLELNTLVSTKLTTKDKESFDKRDAAVVEKSRRLLDTTLDSIGIYLSDAAKTELISNLERLTKGTGLSGTKIHHMFNMTAELKPNGLISVLIDGFYKGYNNLDENKDKEVEDSYKLNNPLYTDKRSVGILARVQANHTPNLFTTTHKNTEGKTIYSYGLNTALSHAVRQFKDSEAFRDRYKHSPFARNSWLLMNKNYSKDRFDLAYMDGLKNDRGNRDGTVRNRMSQREQITAAIGLFQQTGGGSRTFAHYMSMTHSDKTTTPVFMYAPVFNGVLDFNKGAFAFSDALLDQVYQSVFKAEFDRIADAATKTYNLKGYKEASQFFYMLPKFNYKEMLELVKQNVITAEEVKAIWISEGKLNTVSSVQTKKVAFKLIRHQLNELVKEEYNSWENAGLFESGNPFSINYIRQLGQESNLPALNFEKIDGVKTAKLNGEVVDSKVLDELQRKMAAADFTVNSFLLNTSLSQVFYGDPALTWKGSVPKSLAEYSKRLAKDIAPGKDAQWKEPQYTAVTLADYKPFVKELQGMPGYDEAVEGTDAQELTTVREHLTVLYAYGKLGRSPYLKAIAAIDNAKNGYYELDKEVEYLIMQPMKPVVAGLKDSVNGVMVYEYIKSSSFPLLPRMTVGLEIDKLRRAMEKGGVDRVNFSTAKKIGSPTEALNIFNKNGSINEAAFESDGWLKQDVGARQLLNRADFRIQQEVPYDEFKEEIRTISQMNKLIVQGITLIEKPFIFKGQEYSGAKIREFKESIRKKLLSIQHTEFLEKVGAAYDEETGNINFGNKRKLYDLLRTEALIRKGYTLNDIAAVQSFVNNRDELSIPLMLSPSTSKYESLMMSMIKDIVKIKVPGKSFIQGASAGFKTVKTWEESNLDKNAITWVTPIEGELKTAHINPVTGEVLPAQILVGFNYFTADGQTLNIEDYIINVDGKKMLNVEKLPKELFQLIGARIPNQSHSSMLPIEIVGFLPKEMGDLVIVPAAVTRQMGADFDVDKLYTYRRSYIAASDGTLSVNEADTEAMLKNDYFDIHWSVLTNSEMLPKVVSPLDKKDIAVEAELIESWIGKQQKSSYFFSPAYQLQQFQSLKDAKAGVGTSSLANTNNAIVENTALSLFKYVTEGKNTFKEDNPIVVSGLDGKPIHLLRIDGHGVSKYNSEDRTKNNNQVITQNEYVDAAKNDNVSKVGLNAFTDAAWNAMSRLQTADIIDENGVLIKGQALSLDYNTRLMVQDIIQEFSTEMSKANDSLSLTFVSKAVDVVTNKLKVKYRTKLASVLTGKKAEDLTPEDIVEAYRFIDKTFKFNPEGLKDTLLMNKKTPEYLARQLYILKKFKAFDSVGRQLITLQSITTQDTRGAGDDMLSTLELNEKRAKLGTNITEEYLIDGIESLYATDGMITEVGATWKATQDTATTVYMDDLPYAKLAPLFNFISNQTAKDMLSPELKESIYVGMKNYIFSSNKLEMWNDSYAERIRLLYGTEDSKSLAEQVAEAKTSWGIKNYFLQRLSTDIDPDKLRASTIVYSAAKAGRIDDYENMRSWLSMLNSTNEVERKLGENLIKYSLITGGVQNATSFVKYIPFSYLNGTSIAPALREVFSYIESVALTPEFKEQWFQHNPQYAVKVTNWEEQTGSEYEETPDAFSVPVLDVESEKKDRSSLVITYKNEKGRTVTEYPLYVSHYNNESNQWFLYKRQPEIGGVIMYSRIDALGTAQIKEYGVSATGAMRSISPKNRAPWYDFMTPDYKKIENYSMSASRSYKVQYVFQQAGFVNPTGNLSDINNALTVMSSDASQPSHIRVLAGALAQMDRNLVETELGKAFYGVISPMTFEISGEGWKGAQTAKFILNLNKVRLNSNVLKDKQSVAENLVHELMHSHTSLLLAATETEDSWDRMGMPFNTKSNLRVLRKQLANQPELLQKIKAIEDIRTQSFNELKKRIIEQEGESGFRVRMAKMQNHVMEDYYDSLLYALSSNSEFVAQIFTNNNLIGFLNNLKYDGPKTILDHLKDLFNQLWGALLDGLGVRRGTVMEEASKRVLDLVFDTNKYQVNKITESTGDFSVLLNGGDIENYNLQSTPLNPVEKIIGKLEEQLSELKGTFTGVLTDVDRINKSRKIEAIKGQIELLKKEADINKIVEVGRTQMKWVREVLAQPDATSNQLMTANRIASMWEGIIDLIYGSSASNIDAELAKLGAEATNNMMQLQATLIKFHKDNVGTNLRAEDYNPASIEDVDSTATNISMRVRDVASAAKSQLIQRQSAFLQTLGRQRDKDNIILQKSLTDLDRQMTKYPGGKKAVYAKLLRNSDPKEEKDWGLVQEYSGEWFAWRAKLIADRKGILASYLAASKRANESTGNAAEDAINRRSMEDAKSRLKVMWANYWAQLKENAVFVDTRVFFEHTTGELKKGHETHYETLEKELGKEHAAKLVERAQRRFKEYLNQKKVLFDYIESEIAAGDKTLDEAKEEKENFINNNSPNSFFNGLEDNFGGESADRYVTMAPKKSANQFWDAKYMDIQNDTTLKAIYEQYQNILQSLLPYLPKSEQDKAGGDFIPVVSRSLMTNGLSVKEFITGFAERQIWSLTADAYQEQMSARTFNRLPIEFTNKKTVDVKERSTDLIEIARMFGMMAVHYKHMAPAKDLVEMGQVILQEIHDTRVQGKVQMMQNGKLVTIKDGIKNALESLQYQIDYTLYHKPKDLEIKGGKIYAKDGKFTINPVTNAINTKEVNRLIAERDEWERKYVVNEEITKEEYLKAIEPINKELEKYTSRTVYGSKIADKLIKINQLKALSYNPFSAVANMSFGVISVWIHSAGKADFTRKEAGAALKIMTNSWAKWASMGAIEREDAVKVMNIMERMGVLGDYVDSMYGTPVKTKDNIPQWKRKLDPFALMRSGDYFMKGLTTVSVLLHQKVKVTVDGAEKEISVWEALGKDGVWNEAKYGKNPEWFNLDDTSTEVKWDKLAGRVARVNMILHGNQDKNAPKRFNKTMLGRLVGQFRMSWLPEGFYNRWQDEKYDQFLERTVKGRYRTASDLGLAGNWAVLWRSVLDLVPGVKVDYNGVLIKGKKLTDSAVDIENARRNMAELGFYTTLAAMVLMLKSLREDDEDDAKKITILMNLLIRTKQDINFYASPGVFDAVTRNIIPASDVIKDYGKLGTATIKLILDDDYTFDKWLLKLTKAGLPIPQTTLVNKTIFMMNKDLDELSN